MQYFARLSPRVARMWKSRNRQDGDLVGISFKLVGKDYVSGVLDTSQIDAARADPDIKLESVSALPIALETR